MSIDRNTVLHYADLASLTFSEEEADRLAEQLGSILDYVEKINELDLQGIEPTFQINQDQTKVRIDEPRAGLGQDLALKNAPDHANGHFLVPKVINVK